MKHTPTPGIMFATEYYLTTYAAYYLKMKHTQIIYELTTSHVNDVIL